MQVTNYYFFAFKHNMAVCEQTCTPWHMLRFSQHLDVIFLPHPTPLIVTARPGSLFHAPFFPLLCTPFRHYRWSAAFFCTRCCGGERKWIGNECRACPGQILLHDCSSHTTNTSGPWNKPSWLDKAHISTSEWIFSSSTHSAIIGVWPRTAVVLK